MPAIPTFVPAPLINERDYGQYARRPTSASLQRPGSATLQRPSSAKLPGSRPSSAKAYVPKRPQSAKTRYERNSVDYTGVSNMIKSLNIKKSRHWREKSPELKRSKSPPPPKMSSNKSRQAWSSEKDNVSLNSNASTKSKKCDLRYIRTHRSSYYTKFKYSPESHYGSKLGHKAFLERNIPQCLRRYPLYGNLPKRQSCNFKPPNGVTSIKWHSLKSGPLPAYKGPVVAKSSSAPASVHEDDEVNGQQDDEVAENGPHNGSYHYVYGGNDVSNSDIFHDANELDEYENELNKLNNNGTPRDDYSEDDFEEDIEPPESIEIPVRETPIAEEIDEKVWQNAPVTPRTGLKTSSIKRQESARSWVDPDEDNDYYERRKIEEEADIDGGDIPDDIERQSDVAESIKSEHSIRSVDSYQSKESKASKASRSSNRSSSKSSSIKFSDSDMRDILDDNTEDPIQEFMSGTKSPSDEGRYSRMGDTGSSQNSNRFKKSVRIQEPEKSPKTPRRGVNIPSEDEDDIPEDYGSDEDQFDMNDLGSLPPLGGSVGQGGGLTPVPPAGRSRYTRPSSARRRITEDDYSL